MKSILLAIKPQYVNKILNGEKKYEYRRIRCQMPIKRIYIYATYPVKQVVGEALVEEILTDTPSALWEITKEYSGISEGAFQGYFSDKDVAHAYKLGKVVQYKKGKELDSYGLEKAPQSFVYIDT